MERSPTIMPAAAGITRTARQIACFSVLYALVLVFSIPSQAEYYEYIDENGVKAFTDDQSLLPEGNTKTKVHRERFDHLDEAEKQQLLRIEREALERQKQENRDWLEQSRQQEEAEKKKKAELARRKKLLALRTPVAILGNLILVPVTIKRFGTILTVPLLLDTGASVTSINNSVGEQLDLDDGKKSAAIVAGGGILRTRLAMVDTVQVGPRKVASMEIMVIPDNGYDLVYKGLLGQDFLRHFNYTIDYKNKVIQWADQQ